MGDRSAIEKDSPLIGAGVRVDDGLTKDFFGNEISSANIGCYGSTGSDADYDGENIFEKIIRTICDVFETVIHEISVIFD